MFPYDFCKICTNTLFKEDLQENASKGQTLEPSQFDQLLLNFETLYLRLQGYLLFIYQDRSYWEDQWGHDPLTSISEPKRSNSLSFKHQGYFFLWLFKNYTNQKFHDFYRVCYNFWAIYGGIPFFQTKEGK